jgi:cyanophycin synthetase
VTTPASGARPDTVEPNVLGGRPDPASEIRMTALNATRGANYWLRHPIVRMDLVVGAYEDVSSVDVPGFTDAIVRAMPGLIEHRCSIGERGGFIRRLRHGTYAAHIIEHVALELQTMVGHDVGYGRTRGGDVENEYTLIFERVHEQVGLRAAALALETVQRAFAGTLDAVEQYVNELKSLTKLPDVPPLRQRVLCGVTGGSARAETRDELVRRGIGEDELIIDVAPSYILQMGLPYSRSEFAVVLDTTPTDVPERYRDPERASRLVSVVADEVRRDGFVVCPAKAWDVQDRARDELCLVGIFATDDDVTLRDQKLARAVALVERGRILLDTDERTDAGPLRGDIPATAQVAAALAAQLWQESQARRASRTSSSHQQSNVGSGPT